MLPVIDNREKLSWAVALAAGAVVLGYLFFLFPYASGYGSERMTVFRAMQKRWEDPDWTHGMLVPFIVMGLLVYKRKALFSAAPDGSNGWGIAALAFGFFVYWVGYKANVYYFGFAAGQILLGAVILWFLGKEYFWSLFFIWCFFAFTWPLNAFADELRVAYILRIVMVHLSSGFLNLIGLENLVVGTSLQSAPDFTAGLTQGQRFELDVADPCSGIRSLFALLMVTALWGYLTLRRPWQRWVLFFTAPFLAIFGNFIRILLLVFGSIAFGSEFAVGTEGAPSKYHFMAGIFVFVAALGAMVFVSHFLKVGTRAFQRAQIVRTPRAGGGSRSAEAVSGK